MGYILFLHALFWIFLVSVVLARVVERSVLTRLWWRPTLRQWLYQPGAAQPVVLITGASAGIGASFAHECAKQGISAVLVARSKDGLKEVCVQCEKLAAVRPGHGAEPSPAYLAVDCDLSNPEATAGLLGRVDADLETHVPGSVLVAVILNAGFGHMGAYARMDVARVRSMIELNVYSLAELTHRLATRFAQLKRPAGILMTSSIASASPLPWSALYAATKAFVSSFGFGLAFELWTAAPNINVCVLEPGPVKTKFGVAARFSSELTADTNSAPVTQTSEVVAQRALADWACGTMLSRPDVFCDIMFTIAHVLPRTISVRLMDMIFGSVIPDIERTLPGAAAPSPAAAGPPKS